MGSCYGKLLCANCNRRKQILTFKTCVVLQHSLIMVSCLIELFVIYRKRPNWKHTAFSATKFFLIYIIFALIIKYVKFLSIYGIFKGPAYSNLLAIFFYPIMWLISHAGNWIYSRIWTIERIQLYQNYPSGVNDEEIAMYVMDQCQTLRQTSQIRM